MTRPLKMDDPPEEDQHRPEYISYRREVYHRAWQIILEDIRHAARYGMATRCADSTERILFPFIYIISADFEEA